jgi:hypothetical protein
MTVVFVCSRASALSVRMSSFVQSRRFIYFLCHIPPHPKIRASRYVSTT